MSPRRTLNPDAPLELAARALYEGVILSFHYIQEGQDPVDSGRYRNWFDLPEEGREGYRRTARKAAESATFAEYYDRMTVAERLAPEDSLYVAENGRPPAHDEDTERTRGHRAEYYLVQHLLRVDDVTAPASRILVTMGSSPREIGAAVGEAVRRARRGSKGDA